MSEPPAAGILIVCGLRREAKILREPDAIAICGDASTLRARLADMTERPLRLIVSFGICGGLDPGLRPGDLVLGTAAAKGAANIATDAAVMDALEGRLAAAGVRVTRGSIAGVAAPVLGVDDKARLRGATGAVAVDMESAIAGALATERSVPFAILRAVSDPATRSLPPLVRDAMGPEGETKIAAVMGSLLRSPAQLPALIAIARDSAAAFRTLGRCGALPRLFLGLGTADL